MTERDTLKTIREGILSGKCSDGNLAWIVNLCDESLAESGSANAGNAAALRDAVVKALTLLNVCDWPPDVSLDGVVEVIREIDSVLDKPPRNCDEGTVEEQSERFRNFCKIESSASGGHCTGCRAICYGKNKCELSWAQMPYESKEGEGDGSK